MTDHDPADADAQEDGIAFFRGLAVGGLLSAIFWLSLYAALR